MNKNHVSAFLIVREIYESHLNQGYKDETRIQRLKQAKQGAINRINKDLRAISFVSALELCRANGTRAYIEGREHSHILVRKPAPEFQMPLVSDVDEVESHPVQICKTSSNQVYSSASLDKVLEFRKDLDDRENVVVLCTSLRGKYGQSPDGHYHLIRRLNPSFNYFSQFNSPLGAIAAAKVIASGDLVEMAGYVSTLKVASYTQTSELITRAEERLTRSPLHTGTSRTLT